MIGKESRDRPAEIEVTEKMVDAGALVLRDHADGCLGPYTSRHVAEAVFRAMFAASVQCRGKMQTQP